MIALFSVLMSIYHKENPFWFSRAMQSIWDAQTIKPNEIILVQDGPLTPELCSVIDEWKRKLGEVLKCVALEKNVGLGNALDIGFQYCSHELIARMDTDDIAKPDRFEKQLAVFQDHNVDVCGSWVTEFDGDESVITGVRKLPENHADIESYAKYRCPFNHPSVMYKKSAVLKAGGYQKMMWFEDYYLWVRMILSGAICYNIQEPLVHMRAGLGQLERRSGKNYAKCEIELFRAFRSLGFLNNLEFFRVTLLRVPIRLMPRTLIRIVYKFFRKA